MSVGLTIIFIIAIIPIIIVFKTIKFIFRFFAKKCAWCGKRGIKFIAITKESRRWKYPKLDGTRDLRRTGNTLYGGFTATYSCNRCSAVTGFYHDYDENMLQSEELPHPPKSPYKFNTRKLEVKGVKNRKGSNANVALQIYSFNLSLIIISAVMIFLYW